VPERAVAIQSVESDGVGALLRRALGNSPRDAIAIFVGILAAGAILANALYRQPGPHPAPIFSVKPRPVAVEPADVVPALPRAKPPAIVKAEPAPAADVQHAVAKPEAAAPLPVPRPATARPDPIGDLIAGPSPRVAAVQKALNEFGYGPVKATGNHGSDTTAAIQKFERDRKMPVTGQISARLLKELSTLTGKPIE
jgi:hypothetical protein